jgi:hypothetical protein
MSRRPQPWLRQGRGWYVQHNGKQVPLGHDKKLAFQRFHELMTRPKAAQRAARSADTFVGVCDAFLEWTQKNRAPRTYKWYVERLQSFVNYLMSTDAQIAAGEAWQISGEMVFRKCSGTNDLIDEYLPGVTNAPGDETETSLDWALHRNCRENATCI